MSDDRFPTWDDIDREANARRDEMWRRHPWSAAPRPEDIISQGRIAPPLFRTSGVRATCTQCPYAACDPCPFEQEERVHRERLNTPPPSPSWWQRITARLRGGDNQ